MWNHLPEIPTDHIQRPLLGKPPCNKSYTVFPYISAVTFFEFKHPTLIVQSFYFTQVFHNFVANFPCVDLPNTHIKSYLTAAFHRVF